MSRFRTGLSPTNEGTLVEAIRRLHHRRRPRRRDFLVGSAGACLAAAAWPAAAVTQLRSVAEFGAHGDGGADDTAAFAEALANSAVVYVPSGDYRVGRLRIPNGA